MDLQAQEHDNGEETLENKGYSDNSLVRYIKWLTNPQECMCIHINFAEVETSFHNHCCVLMYPNISVFEAYRNLQSDISDNTKISHLQINSKLNYFSFIPLIVLLSSLLSIVIFLLLSLNSFLLRFYAFIHLQSFLISKINLPFIKMKNN